MMNPVAHPPIAAPGTMAIIKLNESSPENEKTIADMRLMIVCRKFFRAFTACTDCLVNNSKTDEIRTPMPAPKNPPYIETANMDAIDAGDSGLNIDFTRVPNPGKRNVSDDTPINTCAMSLSSDEGT